MIANQGGSQISPGMEPLIQPKDCRDLPVRSGSAQGKGTIANDDDENEDNNEDEDDDADDDDGGDNDDIEEGDI